MQTLQHYTQTGSVYTKKNQTVFMAVVGILLLVIVALILIYGSKKPATYWMAGLVAVFGIIILLRITGKFTLDTQARTITNQPVFFLPPQVYSFDDFQNFLVSKQTMLITLNATASMILDKKGRQRQVLLHQTVFTTRVLQRVTDETAEIMGLNA
ncbi:hypothetical protein ECE50_005640 [Chitinophaga sp. Mgbs1]|uniref:Uncharacterized protein n=1 Tax=Chitinophaga solisilvae TaxID=1233460 RepID=A0A3S1CRJ4_9BACT|nr:hypothetical protein [Chitinophaga solisilvae]